MYFQRYPVFVTYAESIFAGATADMVQLKYTWLISRDILEIKTGDTFGIFNVDEATEDYILLKNSVPVNLNQNAVIELGGDMRLKVADSSTTLRFYPYVEYNVQTTTSASTVTSNTSIAAADTTTNVTASSMTATPEPTPDVATQTAAAAPSAATPPVTSTPKKGPGFEVVFAIAGLLAVAIFAMRKRG